MSETTPNGPAIPPADDSSQERTTTLSEQQRRDAIAGKTGGSNLAGRGNPPAPPAVVPPAVAPGWGGSAMSSSPPAAGSPGPSGSQPGAGPSQGPSASSASAHPTSAQPSHQDEQRTTIVARGGNSATPNASTGAQSTGPKPGSSDAPPRPSVTPPTSAAPGRASVAPTSSSGAGSGLVRSTGVPVSSMPVPVQHSAPPMMSAPSSYSVPQQSVPQHSAPPQSGHPHVPAPQAPRIAEPPRPPVPPYVPEHHEVAPTKGKSGKSSKKDKNRPAKKGGLFRGKKKTASSGGAAPPLAASGSLDNRLSQTEGNAAESGSDFWVEGGNVIAHNQESLRKKSTLGLGGGRWQRFAFLGLMVLALGVLVINGAYRLAGKALYEEPKLPATNSFPTEGASSYAELFMRSYFTWDKDHPEERDKALKIFFPSTDENTSHSVGWNGHGYQAVGVTWAVKTDVTSAHRAVITVAANVEASDTRSSGLMCAEVGVYAQGENGNYAILSYPSIVGCPPAAKFTVPDDSNSDDVDSQNGDVIHQLIEQFFTAYADSNYPQMQQLVTKSSGIVSGLDGVRKFGSVTTTVHAPNGMGSDTRTVEATVTWQEGTNDQSGAADLGTNTSQYTITVQREGDHWVIASMKGGAPSADVAPQQGGAPMPSISPSVDSSANGSADGSGDSTSDNDGGSDNSGGSDNDSSSGSSG